MFNNMFHVCGRRQHPQTARSTGDVAQAALVDQLLPVAQDRADVEITALGNIAKGRGETVLVAVVLNEGNQGIPLLFYPYAGHLVDGTTAADWQWSTGVLSVVEQNGVTKS